MITTTKVMMLAAGLLLAGCQHTQGSDVAANTAIEGTKVVLGSLCLAYALIHGLIHLGKWIVQKTGKRK